MIKITTFTLVLALYAMDTIGQTKYWISFKDKPIPTDSTISYVSPKTIAQRKLWGLPLSPATDWPLDPFYIQNLSRLGIQIQTQSKWLNAVSCYLDENQRNAIQELPFVAAVEPINGFFYPAGNKGEELFTEALKDLGGYLFIERGINGSGVYIGVIDAGYYDADREEETSHLFLSGKIVEGRDYLLGRQPLVYDQKYSTLDDHGTEVLQCLAGYDISSGLKHGLATGAQFYLARTDHGKNENRKEEDHWIAALEWMDSLGVRLVNSSLGYATGFDLPEENYKPYQMDGKTSKVSKAAQIASVEKGMLIVVAAGNEGDKADWRVLTTPADAPSVLSVGAVKADVWEKVEHSSTGPEKLSYVKPEVAAFSLKGTSFSAPLITGFAACLMQMDSTVSSQKIKEIIMKSGHLYPFANNFIGYGVPQAKRAIELLESPSADTLSRVRKEMLGKKMTMDLHTPDDITVVVFRKKNTRDVIKQELMVCKKGFLKYQRLKNELFTTFQIGEVVMEFSWKDQ